MKRLFLTVLFLILSCGSALAVTVCDSGCDITYSAYSNLSGNKAGITYTFSGTTSARVNSNIYGTSGSEVILDGWSGGTCAPLDSEDQCSSSALLNAGMTLSGNSAYVIVQDFRITNSTNEKTVQMASGGDHIIFRRNQIKNSAEGAFEPQLVDYLIVEENRIINYGISYNAAENFNIDQVDHALIKNNIIGHSGAAVATSGNVSAIHGSNYILYENNDFYGYTPNSSSAGLLSVKEGGSQSNIIVRFNKFHDNLAGGDNGYGLPVGGGYDTVSYFYAYGNFFYNNIYGGSAKSGALYHYWWANIFSGNLYDGYVIWNYSPAQAATNYIYFLNNTVSYNGDYGTDPYAINRGGTEFSAGSNVTVKNNIYYYNRPLNATKGWYNQLYDSIGASYEHNTLYHPDSTATWYYSGGARSLATMQGTYSREDDSPAGAVRDPLLTDPNGADNTYGTEDDDLTLQAGSSEIDAGTNLSQQFQVNLSGGDSWFETNSGYSTIIMNLDEGLDPNNTNWGTTPPTVKTIKQGNYGSWDRGAYVYTTGETSSPIINDTTETPLSCPNGQDPLDGVLVTFTTDIPAYCRLSLVNESWDDMGEEDAVQNGEGSTNHSDFSPDVACDQTKSFYVACSTEAGDNGYESATIQIDVVIEAEQGINPPAGLTIYGDSSGHVQAIPRSDTSGNFQVTPY